MNEYLQIILTAIATGIGTGTGVAIGTYFTNKALIQNIDKLERLLRTKPSNGERSKDATQ